ncbi:MAG: sigma-70 family RNA polymerase sigma factor [Spiroplasmataceae bacterium]|nr:sigma-70 family RNA polymerase sigma factor [Spiroplasmataceae bacterium]
MNKNFSLKPKKEKELLKLAQPVVRIFLAINSLQKQISEKEQKLKLGKVTPEDIKKLKDELKKKETELKKMGPEKINAGKEAARFLIDYNQNLVKYIAKGYSKRRQIDQSELIAEGIAAAPKAIEKYDLESKNRFATYYGYWIIQSFQTHIKKSQPIDQSSGNKEKMNLIYYDNNYQSDDKEGKSYSLLETLSDDENADLSADLVRSRDIIIQTNNLINSLENREEILLTRLFYKIKPSNLLDIYYLMNEEEKKELKKKMKLAEKSSIDSLQKLPCEEKKNINLPSIKKYLSLFDENYKFSEISKILGKSESKTRNLKQEIFQKLQNLAKKRKLNFLFE